MIASTAEQQQEQQCAKCGGTRLVSARLEKGIDFCLDEEACHGVRRLDMKALLCQDCGYAEFWVTNPSRTLVLNERDHAIQEEDF